MKEWYALYILLFSYPAPWVSQLHNTELSVRNLLDLVHIFMPGSISYCMYICNVFCHWLRPSSLGLRQKKLSQRYVKKTWTILINLLNFGWFGSKPLFKLILAQFQLNYSKTSVKSESKYVFCQENIFDGFRSLSTILFRLHCVDRLH